MDALPLKIKGALHDLISSQNNVENTRFLLAVSGGMDSMVLAHCFLTLKLKFGVAHFNFKLRGEASDLDEELVHSFCKQQNIDFHSRRIDTKKTAAARNLSIQETARNLRYEFFEDVLKSAEYNFICTAHHANDNIETFFIHLLRGSGIKGLTGIPSQRERILRPMLPIPKRSIREYAQKHQIEYRDDESNKSDKYLRNYIRHHIIQPLEVKDVDYVYSILQAIDHLKENEDFVDYQVKKFNENHVDNFTRDIQRIARFSEIINDPGQAYPLKMFLLSQGIYPDSLRNLLDSSQQSSTGSMYEGDAVNAWYDRDQLWIIRDSFYSDWDKMDELILSVGTSMELPGGDHIRLSEKSSDFYSCDSLTIPVHIENSALPLKVRHWQHGDVIEQGAPPYFHKSLKKLFNDKQIPRPFKHRIYILTDQNNNIISIPGLTDNPRYSTTGKSDLTIWYKSQLSFLLNYDTDPEE